MEVKANKKAGLEVAIMLVALVFYGWYAFSRGLWEDELALIADVINAPSIFALINELKWELHAPGCWVLVYIFNKLSLDTPFLMRIPSMIAAALGMVALFRISLKYLPTKWAFIYILFCICLPTFTTHATEIRPHIYLFCFGTWILYFLHEAFYSTLAEDFYGSVRHAVLIFTISIFFHFGSFFMLIALFAPFAFHFRAKLFGSKDKIIGNFRFLIYPAVAILFFCGLYLFSKNLSSVLWSDSRSGLYQLMRSYIIQSYAYHNSYANDIGVIAAIIIFFRFTRNEYEQGLKYLVFIYLWSLAILAAAQAAGLPSSRVKYSLYLLPIATLLFIKGIYLFKGKNIAAFVSHLLLAVAFYLNINHRDQYSTHKAKELVWGAQQILNSDSNSKLLIFGFHRNLSYYFRRYPLPPERLLFCETEEYCVLKHLHAQRSYNLYILAYHWKFQAPELRKLYRQTVILDSNGRLIAVDSAR